MQRCLLFILLIVTSFASNAAELAYKKFIRTNAEIIGKVSLGMTKAQVISAMGDYTSKTPDGKLTNPYKVDASQRDNSTYEVLYFLTRIHPPFTSILDNQASPVVLKDGVVTGIGRSALRSERPE